MKKHSKNRMTMAEAAKAVLIEAGGPLHCNRIWDLIKQKNLYTSSGKTPCLSLYSRLALESDNCNYSSKTKGKKTFTLVGPAIFDLIERPKVNFENVTKQQQDFFVRVVNKLRDIKFKFLFSQIKGMRYVTAKEKK